MEGAKECADYFRSKAAYDRIMTEIYFGKTIVTRKAINESSAENGCGLLCIYGQLKLSGIRLPQMPADSGCRILYAGDFDPEGLQIADRILCRFSEYNVHSWHMTERDYISIEKGEAIFEKRLNKLKSIRSPEHAHAAEILAAINKINRLYS